ncbi:hypothetical protein AVMA1855_15080 [Acidovorax sp. SUPP1855]|uniref:hypothetical protein n=1 Tax=Acidovorax sp. SUPP1855 TaxID=431774 RepID=UPI0023DE5A69|nr:hypothetical protein [Acidovorax sp. SUPP1855]GKS85490.1 hypothetical protein AVMA1855_15080 [Acidovorax sp. SUPP1855]
MKTKPRGLAAAVVLYAIAQGVSAAPATNSGEKPSSAAVATKPVTVSAVGSSQTDAEIERAAVASRRDQDPDLNGSVKHPIPAQVPAASLLR